MGFPLDAHWSWIPGTLSKRSRSSMHRRRGRDATSHNHKQRRMRRTCLVAPAEGWAEMVAAVAVERTREAQEPHWLRHNNRRYCRLRTSMACGGQGAACRCLLWRSTSNRGSSPHPPP
eukprot:scaffold53304_cov27-Tisochrysis_lutea.AAC.3